MSLAISYIENSMWAITRDGLETLISVASREGDVTALEKTLGRKPENVFSSTVRGKTGIIPVQGPLFKRANLLTEVSGATSYELILRDLHAFIENPDISSVILKIDSPGGEANGCAELSTHIREAARIKPVVAYVGGLGASAAYWIASACTKIFAAETAMIGSIGVQTVIRSRDKGGEVSFVSSISPNKNRDPSTEAGAREVQRIVDDLGRIFVERVSENRDLTSEQILERFGQGSVFISSDALSRGMIDSISTFEETLVTLETKSTDADLSAAQLATSHPALAEHFISVGKAEAEKLATDARRLESERILGIQKLADGRVTKEFAENLISEGVTIEQAAVRILSESDRSQSDWVFARKKADDKLSSLDGRPVAKSDQFEEDLQIAQSLGLVQLMGR